MASIPASQIVNINPNVLQAGGSLVKLNGLFLTSNSLMPSGQVISFATSDDVAVFFGSSSDEHTIALKYFTGYSIATSRPGRILFYRVDATATPAKLYSAPITDDLATVKTYSGGNLIITVDSVEYTSSILDFSSANSFSDIANIIEAAFAYSGGTFTVDWNTQLNEFVFTSPTTGTSSTISYCSSTIQGTATQLLLTQVTNAVTIQGTNGVGSSLSASMDAIVAINRNWFTFATVFEATLSQKKSLADWVTTFNADYAYVCHDTNSTATVVNSANDNIENYCKANAIDNVFVVTKDSSFIGNLANYAAFVCGTAAGIDFTATNNRITFAFKQQAGLGPTVTNPSLAQNIIDNGANFYGDYGTKTDQFKFLYPGKVYGKWKYFDELANAAYMKATMQNTLIVLLISVPSIPYNTYGYQGLIATSLSTDLQNFLDFGAIRQGVTLSGTEIAAINLQAKRDITKDLFNKGYVLDVLDPGATVRGERGSPIINLYYTSGGAVHQINMTATLVL